MSFQAEEGYVGIAKQTASGTYETPTDFIYMDSININPDPEDDLMYPDPEIGTGRDIIDAYKTPIKYAGDGDFHARPNTLGWLLLGACGAVTSSGIAGQAGAYGHEFTLENNLPILSIEKQIGDSLDVIGYNDVKINELHLECAAGEFLTGTASLLAKNEVSGKTEQVKTYTTDPIFTYDGGHVELDDSVISVTSLSFDIMNNIKDDDFRIGGRKMETMQEKRRELSAELEIVPEDYDVYRKTYYGSTDGTTASGTGVQDVYKGNLFLKFVTAKSIADGLTQKHEFEVNIPNAFFRSSPINLSGDDQIVETLSMLPYKDGSTGIATLVLRNGKENYN